MRFCIIRNLITGAGFQDELPAILKLGMQLSFKTKQYVSFRTPMVGEVAGRILDHPDSYRAEVTSPPKRRALFAFMFGLFDLRPIGRAEGNIREFHW